MIDFQDIYYKLGEELLEQNFWQVSSDDKKRLIDQTLKQYFILKINEIAGKNLLPIDLDYNVNDLFELLITTIPAGQQANIQHIIHYILNVAGNMQNYSITWWEEEDVTLISQPFASFNESNQWSDLKTHAKTDYMKTFNFVYDLFLNSFMKTNNCPKHLGN